LKLVRCNNKPKAVLVGISYTSAQNEF